MEKEMTDLETKLTQLSIGVERTQAILDSGKRVAIKRHLEALQTAKETNECKRTVEAAKITEKEELSKINEWSDEIDHGLRMARRRGTSRKVCNAGGVNPQKAIDSPETVRLNLRFRTVKNMGNQRARSVVDQKAQREAENSQEIEAIKRELNLQPNEMGILECGGRIEGKYPIYLPRDCTYTEKMIEQAHLATLHGGVANVRERFWVS
ncbi:Hypothetical predicted protein [Paramuricea clavata]|uniref:Uncharacterized protein n=1 Tax=Paramuricea clavata TaxID=317549 RepID=A0A6S7GVT0_PARCT|nr:Hypothetical predicted protein [Paramuricea clavata]